LKLDSDEEETVPDPEPAEKDENTSNPFETVQPPKPVEDPKPQISVSSHRCRFNKINNIFKWT
jgi:hypothetical protein